MSIANGQARRIAAEWQAPRNAFSLLQHKGIISGDLVDEIHAEMRKLDTMFGAPLAGPSRHSRRELAALARWAEEHGPGKVTPWGEWSDKPAR